MLIFAIEMESTSQHPIVFFDGYCTLCNNSVDQLMRMDKRRRLRYASLQGKTAKALLPAELMKDVDSVICLNEGKVFVKSDAAFEVLRVLGGSWAFFRIFRILPKSIRDSIYDWVARNRYKWFGKRDTCRLPNEEEKALFMD